MNQGIRQEPDMTGLKTLELFSEARAFNRWMFDAIAPYCSGNILEIGSGIGNISELLLKEHELVTLSDLRIGYCDILKKRFNGSESLENIFQIDLVASDFNTRYGKLLGRFDRIIALNVIEHIEDDLQAVKNCNSLLKPGGRLIVLVPAFQSLYNSLDKELGHFRRYTKNKLSVVLEKGGMAVGHTKYFNSAGIIGWFFSGSILRRKVISSTQLKIYNKLIPLFRLIDKLTSRVTGLSVIAVATKPGLKV